MGFEFGFAKVEKNEEETFDFDDVYWDCRGWENVDLFKAFARLSKNGRDVCITGYGECNIAIEELSFIDDLAGRLVNNSYYATITLLRTLNPTYADEYFQQLDRDELASLRLSFIVPNWSNAVRDIIASLYDQFEQGYFTVESLIDGYRRMKEDGVKEVILYGG